MLVLLVPLVPGGVGGVTFLSRPEAGSDFFFSKLMDFRPPEAAGLSCARSALLLKSLKKGVLRAAGGKNEVMRG